jgi:hypothetical protein
MGFTKGVLEGRGRSEGEREREMSVSSNPRFFFLVKDKVRKRGLSFFFLFVWKEGMKEGMAIAIGKMAAKNIPAADIAAILEVNIQLVHQVLAGVDRG